MPGLLSPGWPWKAEGMFTQVSKPRVSAAARFTMKLSKTCLYLTLFLTFAMLSACSVLNSYQKEGTVVLPGLREPVTVVRDEKGMAYVYARSMEDAIMAQGFVTAQDRLFQMELTRLVATGRICELAGDAAKPLAIRMKTIGFFRNAERQVELLDPETRKFLQKYVEGVNAFIDAATRGAPPGIPACRHQTHPVAHRGFPCRGLPHELGDGCKPLDGDHRPDAGGKGGARKGEGDLPLNVNPDEGTAGIRRNSCRCFGLGPLSLGKDETVLGYLGDRPLRLGSNNWCVGPGLSEGGKPILANDPHLDARMLPGPWYPIGLITPDVRAVGVSIPGVPALMVGRTEHVAFGITNAYGDNQDLYVETLDPLDPERYLEGERSLPFERVEETLRIKDRKSPGGFREEKLTVRLTRRGPVISDVLTGLETQKVVTLRWLPFEYTDPCVGLHPMLGAEVDLGVS
jgi:penicillin G amidase